MRAVPEGLRRPGPATFGTWVKLPSLETLEMLAMAGFEFVVIDMEHSPLTLDFAYSAIVVAQSMDMTALVRVPDRSGSHTQRLLDAGADGLLVPQVSDAAEAQRCVDLMVHPPHGTRGSGGTSRAGRWGLTGQADYLGRGQQTVRGVQLEDVEALAQMDAILDVPNLNAVFLGTGDLSLSSGLPPTAPDLQALTDKLLAATACPRAAVRDRGRRRGCRACSGSARVLLRDGEQRRDDVRAVRCRDRRCAVARRRKGWGAVTLVDYEELGLRGMPPLSARHKPDLPGLLLDLDRVGDEVVAQPFVGITTDGVLVPGLFPIAKTGISTTAMVDAAQAYLQSLDATRHRRGVASRRLRSLAHLVQRPHLHVAPRSAPGRPGRPAAVSCARPASRRA